MTVDSVEKGGHRELLRQPLSLLTPQKSNSPDSKPSKKAFKDNDKDAEVSSPQMMASGRDAGGEGLSFLKEDGHWEFDHASVST